MPPQRLTHTVLLPRRWQKTSAATSALSTGGWRPWAPTTGLCLRTTGAPSAARRCGPCSTSQRSIVDARSTALRTLQHITAQHSAVNAHSAASQLVRPPACVTRAPCTTRGVWAPGLRRLRMACLGRNVCAWAPTPGTPRHGPRCVQARLLPVHLPLMFGLRRTTCPRGGTVRAAPAPRGQAPALHSSGAALSRPIE
jgi:hypothetical protein